VGSACGAATQPAERLQHTAPARLFYQGNPYRPCKDHEGRETPPAQMRETSLSTRRKPLSGTPIPALACPQVQTTRLQPPFFSTGLVHLGQGLVLMAIQFLVSLSPVTFSSHRSHILPAKSYQGSTAQKRFQLCVPGLDLTVRHLDILAAK